MDANMASEARNNALWRKPAVICENKRHSIGYPHIFDHARLIADAADIARRRPTTGIQNGGLYTGSTLYLCNGMRYQRNSNGYPHIFDHGRLIADTGDIAPRRPTETVGFSLISHSIAEIHCTSGLQSVIFNSGSQPPSGNDKQRNELFLTKSIHNIHELLK